MTLQARVRAEEVLQATLTLTLPLPLSLPLTRHEYALKKCCKRTAAQEKKGIEHLLEEKQAQASLNHPAIVRLFDAFQEEEFCYFLMELCRGGLP